MKDSLVVLGVGFAVVFVGLLCLIGIIYLMSFIVKLVRRENLPRIRHEDDTVPEGIVYSERPVYRPSLLAGPDRRAAVAAISAAVAEYLDKDVSGLRILSIKQIGEKLPDTDRRELIAVISAAIASDMNTDVSGIRIHSIKKVS